jgi:pyridoxal phosphate enzyme (YggS family)
LNRLMSRPPDNAPLATQPRHEKHGLHPKATSVVDFQRHLAAVHARIAQACQRAGRAPASVRLLPVSKTMDEASIRLAYAAGLRLLGENKVQEAHRKWEAMADLADLRWSIIGHLQTNKARLVARFAAEFQALDSLRSAEALDRRLQAEGRPLDVFVQVNTSGEASKYGLNPDDVPGFLRALPAYAGLRVRGLMTLALFSSEASRVRPCFIRCAPCATSCGRTLPPASAWPNCPWVCRGISRSPSRRAPPWCGSGQAIFGARRLPDSHFWPTADERSTEAEQVPDRP